MSCSRSQTMQMTPGANILSFASNSAELRDVMNNACVTLDFKLLAVERNITPAHEAPCLYDLAKINFSCCTINESDHAHMYISTNILNQHCIILFAKITQLKISDIDSLVDKFCNSIDRLKTQNANFLNIYHPRKLRFYMYFHGDGPVTINNLNRHREKFSRKLEQRLGYNKFDLNSCVVSNVIIHRDRMTISQQDNLLRFVFS